MSHIVGDANGNEEILMFTKKVDKSESGMRVWSEFLVINHIWLISFQKILKFDFLSWTEITKFGTIMVNLVNLTFIINLELLLEHLHMVEKIKTKR